MFSKDKIRIRYSRLFKSFFFHTAFWALAFMLFSFLVTDNYLLQVFDNINLRQTYSTFIILISVAIAIIFSFVDFIFTDRVVRFFPIQLTLFFKSLLNFAIAFVIIWAAETQTFHTISLEEVNDILITITEANIHLIRFLVYFYLLCFLNNFIVETLKKVGAGNLNSWVSGVLNKPHEQERIFMFIDLKSSTTIAEKLGHKKFSHLVQDVFNDMAVVDNYGGEIYNYMGDGAIVSWNVRKGVKRGNCMKAFYAVLHVVDSRKRYYKRKYGFEPKFKAGIHIGKVMVLQVGQIRRDISYNGDTMNTAARIESQCNELRQSLLISGDLHNLLHDNKNFRFKNVGNIKLKGKAKGIDIFGVKEKV
ncbi:MAG: adenylate/guanylate cyclase domain-containing protein [Salinivirgaceae bacterium]|jgi:adenylate cyclase|nr:adenylate/guanylate cyclase domain-containing protein [Salinivirgaceae bacterium]